MSKQADAIATLMKSARVKVLGFVALVLLIPLVYLLFEHFRGRYLLGKYLENKTAAGEVFDIQRLRPAPIPSQNNAAFDLAEATIRRPNTSGMEPASMRLTSNGTAIVSIWLTNWVGHIPTPQGGGPKTNITWAMLEERLDRGLILELQRAVERPEYVAPLDYLAGYNMLLPHLGRLKSAGTFLSLAARSELRQQKLDEALLNLKALGKLATLLTSEPIIISQLVTASIANIGTATIWEALQLDGWSESQLRELQEAWSHLEFMGPMRRAWEMDRAGMILSFEQGRHSSTVATDLLSLGSWNMNRTATTNVLSSLESKLNDIMEHPDAFFGRNFYQPVWVLCISYFDELHYLEMAEKVVKTARVSERDRSLEPVRELDKWLTRREAEAGALDRVSHPVSATVSWGPNALVRAGTAAIHNQLVVTALALKRYQLKNGHYPPSLEVLQPDYLPAMPVDFADGQVLRYRRNVDGTFLLYSVGENGVDDGGENAPPPGQRGTKDISSRLDMVWPTAERTSTSMD